MCKTGKLIVPKLKWKEYWNDTSVKYPSVPGWKAVDENGAELKDSPLEIIAKTKIFNRAMTQRQSAFHSNYADDSKFYNRLRSQVETSLVNRDVAVIVPSSGKGGRNQLYDMLRDQNAWWSQMVFGDFGKVVVILLVSEDEVQAYESCYESFYKAYLEHQGGKTALLLKSKLKIVSYHGTGIGNGRVAGHLIARILKIPCWLVDDRAKDVKYKSMGQYEVPTELKAMVSHFSKSEQICTQTLKPVSDHIKVSCNERIVSAYTGLQFKFRVLTVVFPIRTTAGRQLTFPKYFIASKEDLAFSELYNVFDENYFGNYNLTVTSQQSKETYENKPYDYPDKKDAVLTAVINGDVYEFEEKDKISGTTHWDKFKSLEFKNKWDAVKVQETILFELLGSIVKAVGAAYNVSGSVNPPYSRKLKDAFEKNVLPWFELP